MDTATLQPDRSSPPGDLQVLDEGSLAISRKLGACYVARSVPKILVTGAVCPLARAHLAIFIPLGSVLNIVVSKVLLLVFLIE